MSFVVKTLIVSLGHIQFKNCWQRYRIVFPEIEQNSSILFDKFAHMPNLIFIGLGTYMRPNMLGDTLRSFYHVVTPAGTKLLLYVSDNDPEGSAQAVFDEHKEHIPFDCYYLINEKRGTVNQRNRIIEEALNHHATHIAMVDDDETVSPEWMVRMLEVMQQYEADVVDGAVQRILPSDTPQWMIKGGFYEWKSFKTGSIRQAASGASSLFKIRLVSEMGLRFHPAFNLTGGSDTFFFTEATKKGAKIVWLDERLVQEYFPKSRVNEKWILKRAFRRTSSKFNRKRLEMGYPRAAVTYTFNGVFQLLTGALIFVLAIPFGPIARTQSKRLFMKGLGTFNGILGKDYEEYKHVHGN